MTRAPRYKQHAGASLCAALIYAAAAIPSTAVATEFDNTDDVHAQFHVVGSLLESACHLDMRSAYQEVRLGEIGTADLPRPGDQGVPVAVELTLRGCVRIQGGRREENGGALAWSGSEPVIGVTFRAQADPDTPELVGVRGASGFGLRLSDANRRRIALGQQTRAWFVTPGDAVLTYYVTPERTSAPLRPGYFQAYINLFLTYD
ncbi:fimbrial protein [Achromobacter marplatensis]|uniref:fimbrial protein n=1 Tax=Achromobacter marplatensis TaxID=470868 RepID=UPI0039F7179A